MANRKSNPDFVSFINATWMELLSANLKKLYAE